MEIADDHYLGLFLRMPLLRVFCLFNEEDLADVVINPKSVI